MNELLIDLRQERTKLTTLCLVFCTYCVLVRVGSLTNRRPGSLFPALHRMEQKGWIEGSWGESENNRRAKFYRLTAAGRRQLGEEKKNWAQVVLGVGKVLQAT